MLFRVIVKGAKESGDIPLKYDSITCEHKNHLYFSPNSFRDDRLGGCLFHQSSEMTDRR